MSIILSSHERSIQIFRSHLKVLHLIGIGALLQYVLLYYGEAYSVGELTFMILDISSKLVLLGVIVGYFYQLVMHKRRVANMIRYDDDSITYTFIKKHIPLFMFRKMFRTYRVKDIQFVKFKKYKVIIYGKIQVTDKAIDYVRETELDCISIPRCFPELETLMKKRAPNFVKAYLYKIREDKGARMES